MLEQSRGVTLLELLVTLAAGLILLSIGAPAFRHTIANGERTAAVNGLLSALHLARRIALSRAQSVVLCKAPEGGNCRRGSEVDWADGLIAFVNLDGDDPPQLDADEPVIHRGHLPAGVQITANREAFSMRADGKRSTNGTFTVCDRRGAAYARAVIVSWTGRPRVASTHPDGDALSCPAS